MKISAKNIAEFMSKMGFSAPAVNKNSVAEQIREDARELSRLEDELKAAAAVGDEKRYQALSEQKATRENALNMHRMQLDTAPDYYTRASVDDAWKKYVTQHNKEFKAKYESYIKARSELAEKCKELLLFRNDALRMRDICWESVIGKDSRKNDEMRDSFTNELLMSRMGLEPELTFFEKTGYWDPDTAFVYDSIVRGHTVSAEVLEHPEEWRDVRYGVLLSSAGVAPVDHSKDPAPHIFMRASGK